MPLPQNIPINITPENVWAVLDAVESDFEDDLADVMEDSDTEFVVEDEQKDDNKDKDQEADTSISDTNQSLHAIVHDLAKDNDTDVQDEKINESSNVVDSAAKSKDDTLKEIHWTKSTRYINAQKECTKFNGEVLLDIDPLDNPLKVFEKLINLDEFLHHLKLESERYAAQNGKTFEVSMDELRAFIGVNFVFGYHKLPNLRNYWETRSPSLSMNCVANVMIRERFKEILGNLHFSNNEDVVPRDHPAHDRAFKVRCLIDYLNERFLRSMKPEVEQSVDEHMIRYKGRSIMQQHIKNKPIKWGFRMWYRCASKIGYLY